ncbi:hypothetical protein BN946_scf184985.g129 [Trametes cinnabarina]|uniref:Transmembrane protein n=1 Tax=Pycnoporus cinnabarinus TaxID=5643 RepID=A0A060SKE6_PYCCI|nr:hypothetical protein BN946_scf184985.g129 [Trametes cinnabarina]
MPPQLINLSNTLAEVEFRSAAGADFAFAARQYGIVFPPLSIGVSTTMHIPVPTVSFITGPPTSPSPTTTSPTFTATGTTSEAPVTREVPATSPDTATSLSIGSPLHTTGPTVAVQSQPPATTLDIISATIGPIPSSTVAHSKSTSLLSTWESTSLTPTGAASLSHSSNPSVSAVSATAPPPVSNGHVLFDPHHAFVLSAVLVFIFLAFGIAVLLIQRRRKQRRRTLPELPDSLSHARTPSQRDIDPACNKESAVFALAENEGGDFPHFANDDVSDNSSSLCSAPHPAWPISLQQEIQSDTPVRSSHPPEDQTVSSSMQVPSDTKPSVERTEILASPVHEPSAAALAPEPFDASSSWNTSEDRVVSLPAALFHQMLVGLERSEPLNPAILGFADPPPAYEPLTVAMIAVEEGAPSA